MTIIITVKICVCNIQVWHFCFYEALFSHSLCTSVSYKKTLQCSYSGLCEVHLLHIKSNCHVRRLKQRIFFKINFKNSLTHNNLVITLSTFIQSSKASVQDWQHDTKFVAFKPSIQLLSWNICFYSGFMCVCVTQLLWSLFRGLNSMFFNNFSEWILSSKLGLEQSKLPEWEVDVRRAAFQSHLWYLS